MSMRRQWRLCVCGKIQGRYNLIEYFEYSPTVKNSSIVPLHCCRTRVTSWVMEVGQPISGPQSHLSLRDVILVSLLANRLFDVDLYSPLRKRFTTQWPSSGDHGPFHKAEAHIIIVGMCLVRHQIGKGSGGSVDTVTLLSAWRTTLVVLGYRGGLLRS